MTNNVNGDLLRQFVQGWTMTGAWMSKYRLCTIIRYRLHVPATNLWLLQIC